MSLTYKETKSQYKALRKTFSYLSEQKESLEKFFKDIKPKSITFIGSGSSYYISQSFEIIANVKMGIAASSMAAGDLMLHYESYRKSLSDTLIVAVSRSGSTSEIINAINNVKSIKNIPVLSISCIENSELGEISDICIELPWAFDESVCQTRTVSNLYAAVLQIIGYWSNDARVIRDLDTVIEKGDIYLEKYEGQLKSVAAMDWGDAVVLADGELQGISMVGALAFKEISQTPASYYHVLDSRHGPIVMINDATLVIACISDDDTVCQVELIRDIIRKGAKVIVYTNRKINEIEGVILHVFSEIPLEHSTRGIPFINISQIVAYYKALQKNINPDSPDGLDAWIKL